MFQTAYPENKLCGILQVYLQPSQRFASVLESFMITTCVVRRWDKGLSEGYDNNSFAVLGDG